MLVILLGGTVFQVVVLAGVGEIVDLYFFFCKEGGVVVSFVSGVRSLVCGLFLDCDIQTSIKWYMIMLYTVSIRVCRLTMWEGSFIVRFIMCMQWSILYSSC